MSDAKIAAAAREWMRAIHEAEAFSDSVKHLQVLEGDNLERYRSVWHETLTQEALLRLAVEKDEKGEQ